MVKRFCLKRRSTQPLTGLINSVSGTNLLLTTLSVNIYANYFKNYVLFLLLIRELDVEAMREAAALLVGVHDFSSFRAVNSDLPFRNPVRTLDAATIRTGVSFAQAHFHR